MFSTKSVLKINRLLVGMLCLYLASCTPEDDKQLNGTFNYKSGVFVVNEGNTTSGSISFYDKATKAVQDDVYAKANNNATVGNSLQFCSFLSTYSYFVSSKSNTLTIANPNTFQNVATLTGFEQPQQFISVGTRSFVSQWGANGLTGSIKVIDNTFNKVTTAFDAGKGPTRLEFINGLLWVLNSGGAGKDSTIQQFFLNSTKDSLINTIALPLGPKDMIRDANGDVWVLCASYPDRKEGGKLVRIKDDKVELSYDVPKGADKLVRDVSGNNLYFIADNKVWQKNLLNFGKTAPSVFGGVKKTFQSLTAIGFDADDNMYCADALDNNTLGTVFIFDKTTFAEIGTFKVGIKPTAFIFR
jgi:hypothetical protein